MSQHERERSRSALRRAREEALAVLDLRHSGRRIDSSDYERRVAAVGRATRVEELEALLRDPAPEQGSVPAVPAAQTAMLGRAHIATSELDLADEQGFVFAVMSGARRRGHWEPPARLYVTALMGGADLDFREADLLEGVSEVVVLALMGGVNIIVPPELDVEVNGVGLLGGFPHLSRRSDDHDAPLLRIRGLALMGGVNVKVKK